MAVAWIVELMGDGTHTARGLYEFVALPVTADRLSLAKPEGGFDIMGVVLVEHVPAPTSPAPSRAAATEPSATVYVQWIVVDDGSRQSFI
jgi:hypothetical protein